MYVCMNSHWTTRKQIEWSALHIAQQTVCVCMYIYIYTHTHIHISVTEYVMHIESYYAQERYVLPITIYTHIYRRTNIDA
jgi:hypothetical protein